MVAHLERVDLSAHGFYKTPDVTGCAPRKPSSLLHMISVKPIVFTLHSHFHKRACLFSDLSSNQRVCAAQAV